MTTAKNGEKIGPKALQAFKKRYKIELPETVVAPCGAQDGQWLCVVCGEVFPNNLQAHSHVSEKKGHKLAWRCSCSQVESPV